MGLPLALAVVQHLLQSTPEPSPATVLLEHLFHAAAAVLVALQTTLQLALLAGMVASPVVVVAVVVAERQRVGLVVTALLGA